MHPHLFSYRCYIQEIMSCLILLSEESWRQRLSYLFDVFKCSGNDEMMYDEVVLAGQVVAMSLYRLWGSSSWDQAEWSHLTEGIADGAYAKVCDALMSSVPLHLKSLFCDAVGERPGGRNNQGRVRQLGDGPFQGVSVSFLRRVLGEPVQEPFRLIIYLFILCKHCYDICIEDLYFVQSKEISSLKQDNIGI